MDMQVQGGEVGGAEDFGISVEGLEKHDKRAGQKLGRIIEEKNLSEGRFFIPLYLMRVSN